ncbi:PREDICTED: uncharacterized protein LOC107349619 isoform X2 [Acropora digitifera]|uniref:uncharacterized protein LOC107349619 isoform X2 n=1 Tax=Acropora digitifera TaxID=70779 RepID=UPI00077AC54B|nr:PREDICTED: uncharacterized protein LOC107349619 isoform X2 [Acropora digitifera]
MASSTSSTYTPAKRFTDADMSRSGGDPLKVLYFLSEGKQSRQLKTRCIASAVVVNGKHLLLTSSSAIKEEDKKESLILKRFSRKNFGHYTVKASFFKEFGEFTFLKTEGTPNKKGGKRTMCPLNLELPPSKSLKAFTSLCAVENFEFKFKYDIESRMIELIGKKSTRIEKTSIAGAPIINEQSGRFFIIGVLGLTSDKKLYPSYLNKNILEIMKQLQPLEKSTRECLKDEQESQESTTKKLGEMEDRTLEDIGQIKGKLLLKAN